MIKIILGNSINVLCPCRRAAGWSQPRVFGIGLPPMEHTATGTTPHPMIDPVTDPSPGASKALLLSRRFAPLFWCQFFSAFSDNFLKNALVFLILFKIGGSAAESLITLAAAVFIAPYFFLSALGGEIADRYDKAVIAQRLKLAEIGVSVIAIIGFVMHSVPLLFV